MGIDVYLETESGEKIDELLDPKGIVAHLMPIGEDQFPLLRNVDLYGDTVFNRLQMEQMCIELELLKKRSRNSEEIEYIDKLVDMAGQCQAEPHLYLKFYGD